MKIDTSDVKKGTVLNMDGQLFRVYDLSHTHTGRGGATYTFKAKNILTGANNTFTYKSGATLEGAEVNYNNATYLYNSGETYSFMEADTSEVFDIDSSVLEDSIPFLKENLDVFLIKYQGNVIGIVLPATIKYKIVSTVPGVKGDRATAGKKPATLETGLEVQVPLFASEGDEVTINTSTGEVS